MSLAAGSTRIQPDHHTDVLVIGGGMAGAWAALSAARTGVRVTLVDKGACGTSGVTATAGPGHWWVPPEGDARSEAIARRALAGEGLADPAWMARALDHTWRLLPTVGRHYRFGVDEQGQVHWRALRGPEYGRALRKLVDEAGVTVLDHHPALELLADAQGAVAGAAGLRLADGQSWSVRAGAVVLASGGCAFRAKLLGADNNTGDGLLMAAEAGAELSGMEFTNAYTVAPVFSSMTRSMSYVFADYFDANGRQLDVPNGPAGIAAVGRALLQGRVWCTLARMPADIRTWLPQISPNVLLVFRRRGIDPFRDRFEVTLRGEGTVRGIGGLRHANADAQTTVDGLYAAGDVASREPITGAISGGGAQNSAWALTSGWVAGHAAARHARSVGAAAQLGALTPLGQAGLRPRRRGRAVTDAPAALTEVQTALLAPDHNMFREATTLRADAERLAQRWAQWREDAGSAGTPSERQHHRELAGLLAAARWSVSASLARRETRGMHWRTDAPNSDEAQAYRLAVGGLGDTPWVRPLPVNEEAPA